jgi:mono/diheme cytochrome c family protein
MILSPTLATSFLPLALLGLLALPVAINAAPTKFFQAHCIECHDGESKQGGLDLSSLKLDPHNSDNFALWVRIHDRISSGEMPPKRKPRPPVDAQAAALKTLREDLLAAERKVEIKPRLRRLTRAEYENTIRDLFDMPGLLLQAELPPDGVVEGFDKHGEALDLSHVNLQKYFETADRVLDSAIATRPKAPKPIKQWISLANPSGFVAHVLMHGDGVILKDKKIDPNFPPASEHMHLDEGAHQRIGLFRRAATVGLFRHEDESFHPYFNEFVAIYPGRYRLTMPLWSFQWDQGKILPSRGTEAGRLSIVQLVGDGRGGGHPSTVLGYYAAASMKEEAHKVTTWLNPRETIGFNAASLVSGHTRGPKRAMGFTGPAIACDGLEVEGPIHETWPPLSHRRLFGDLPIEEFDPKLNAKIKPPVRSPDRQQLFMARNRPDPIPGLWTVRSHKPLDDADRLLADFLPRAFRRAVSDKVRQQYVAKVEERLKVGDCFELAMRWAYRAALCSPDFLYHVEPMGELDDHALACRLSYFLWNSMPDETLSKLANEGALRKGSTLREQVSRLLSDPKSNRFIEDFLGQWLKLRLIAANDADRQLYPEFNKYLQDSMVAESHAYFRELLQKNLSAEALVKSDFVMINGRLATHYNIPDVSGPAIRRVKLPAGTPRGGLLSQAAVLKVTANGTTTSPVPRGAFVMEKLLGQTPPPPPPNIAAVEPDVRGAVTIREQLSKHRDNPSCASCHVKMDPPGFALEEFDVLGGHRSRYRSLGKGDPAPRGNIDPFLGISFRLGPKVDSSGTLSDGRTFANFAEFQDLLAKDRDVLLANMARQFAVYSTTRGKGFGERAEVDALVAITNKNGGGLKTLIENLVQSRLFQTRGGGR